jgi:uncharacterized SAM-binding protein YcdF (DUF218 family)
LRGWTIRWSLLLARSACTWILLRFILVVLVSIILVGVFITRTTPGPAIVIAVDWLFVTRIVLLSIHG